MIDLAEILKTKQSPLIMGIVNATPDSFSDGNDSLKPLDKSLKLLDDGADIIDIGGESTRPNAKLVSVEEELERVLGVVKSLRKLRPKAIISVDTRKFEVAKATLEAGADIINDVSNLNFDKGIAKLVGEYQAGLILMHSKGTPENMQSQCNYHELVNEVGNALQNSMAFAIKMGVKPNNIWIDPGLGFAKNMEQNFALLKATPELAKIAPVLIGHSRKNFIRTFLNVDTAHADIGTLAVSIFAMNNGAKILRVHDVKNSVDAINIYQRCNNG